VSHREKGEEEGEDEEEKDEDALTGEGAPRLKPMDNMGIPTYLKLSGEASHLSNMAAIAGAISTITTVLRHESVRNVPSSVLEETQIGPHLMDLGCALLLSTWANLPNEISPRGSSAITTVEDTFFYCFKGAPLEAVIPPTPAVPVTAAVHSSSTRELLVHPMELDTDFPADGLEFTTPKAPSKKAKEKHREGAPNAP
jgi:hypothetical protein